MIILTTTALQVNLSAVSVLPLPIIASYVDLSDSTYSPNPLVTATNGVTLVSAVPAPDVNYARQIKLLSIPNVNVLAATVNIYHGTSQLLSVTLLAGSTLVYTDGRGFSVIDSTGQTLTAVGSNASSNYTQTGLITFSRGVAAPFAVAVGSTVVTNLNADLLDGLDSTAFVLATTPLGLDYVQMQVFG